jgi:hypothetical protein
MYKLFLKFLSKPSYDPFKEVCFFYFPGFTDFQKAVSLLLGRIILNLNVQALSKVFNKLFCSVKS